MKVYRIWDVVKEMYIKRRGSNVADQSCWDSRATATQVAGRLLGRGMYEIHPFHLQKVEE